MWAQCSKIIKYGCGLLTIGLLSVLPDVPDDDVKDDEAIEHDVVKDPDVMFEVVDCVCACSEM